MILFKNNESKNYVTTYFYVNILNWFQSSSCFPKAASECQKLAKVSKTYFVFK